MGHLTKSQGQCHGWVKVMPHLWARWALGAPLHAVSLGFSVVFTSGVLSLLNGIGKEEIAVA